MTQFSSLSFKEEFTINGTLSPNSIDALLDSSDQLGRVVNVDSHIHEALANLPAEDFLSSQVEELNDLLSNLRGKNKEKLQHILENINDALQCQFNSSDYASHELNTALKTIKGV
jgi:hypothetical protein